MFSGCAFVVAATLSLSLPAIAELSPLATIALAVVGALAGLALIADSGPERGAIVRMTWLSLGIAGIGAGIFYWVYASVPGDRLGAIGAVVAGIGATGLGVSKRQSAAFYATGAGIAILSVSNYQLAVEVGSFGAATIGLSLFVVQGLAAVSLIKLGLAGRQPLAS